MSWTGGKQANNPDFFGLDHYRASTFSSPLRHSLTFRLAESSPSLTYLEFRSSRPNSEKKTSTTRITLFTLSESNLAYSYHRCLKSPLPTQRKDSVILVGWNPTVDVGQGILERKRGSHRSFTSARSFEKKVQSYIHYRHNPRLEEVISNQITSKRTKDVIKENKEKKTNSKASQPLSDQAP